MAIRWLSIDDEALARKGLAMALSLYPDFECIKQYSDVEDLLNDLPIKIDVLFVDIEMPSLSGFELLNVWPEPIPLVVFVTAYDQYAVQAFENQALDYLVKPIKQNRLGQVVERIRGNLQQQKQATSSELLLQTINNLKQQIHSNEAEICIKTDDGYFQVKVIEVLYLEAAGDHVCLHFANSHLITRDTLKNFLARLNEYRFCQIHKSFMVNLSHVKQFAKLRFGDYELVLSNDIKLRLSRNYKSVISQLT
ncbi:MAG: response regulator transcription factor [Colwellia sp.]|nr:response regulator transcription factor [Colwellia sp.]